MEAKFWNNKWAKNEIGFHNAQANPLLVENFRHLALPSHSRVFIPLCGKTLDIHWLLANGYKVVGAELSQSAIEQLFSELSLTPTITRLAKLKRYRAENIDIYVGDIFEITRETLGVVHAIYDRAALVALPEPMRTDYTRHLINITDTAPQLLIKFFYDQSVMNGPPFAIKDTMVAQYYEDHYALEKLCRIDVVGGLKGKCPATESVWTLTPIP